MRKNRSRSCGLVALTVAGCLVVAGSCSNVSAQPSTSRPEWIAHPKIEDGYNVYSIGEGVGNNPEAARDAAYQNALKRLSEGVLAEINAAGAKAAASTKVPIRGAEIVPDSVYDEKDGRQMRCWVQVAYPRGERVDVINKVRLGAQLNSVWGEAQAAAGAGKYEQAISLLDSLLLKADKALGLAVNLDEARLLQAQCYEKLYAYQKARGIYEQLVKLSADPAVRGKATVAIEGLKSGHADNAWREEFGNKKLAILCAYRTDDKVLPWQKLGKDMSAFLQGMGGIVEAGGSGPEPRDVLEWAGKPESAAPSSGLDAVVIMTADGKMVTRENKQNPSGNDYQFNGKVKAVVVKAGKIRYSDEFTAITGWNPVSEQMCMEVLALNVFQDWKKKFAKTFVSP